MTGGNGRTVLTLALLWMGLAGCGEGGEPIERWHVHGEDVTLPAYLAPIDGRTRTITAELDIPRAWTHRELELTWPWLEAPAVAHANGQTLVALHRPSSGYREAQPQRWRVPPTDAETIALEVTIERRWPKADWLVSVPEIHPATTSVGHADTVHAINTILGWVTVSALLQIGLACILIFLADRRLGPYLWFGIQAVSASSYPLFTMGVTQGLGPYDLFLLELGLLGALGASVVFTHRFFELERRIPRVLLVMLAVTALLAVLFPTGAIAMRTSVPAVVVTLTACLLHQIITLTRRARRPPERGSVQLYLVAWVALLATTWADMISWLGVIDVFAGARPANLGLLLFSLALSFLLSRRALVAMRRQKLLAGVLEERVAELEVERANAEALNETLASRIADRSGQLFAALQLLAGDGDPPVFAAGDTVDGRYELLRPLGAGAMGAVFEVERVSDGQRFAMKVSARVEGSTLARMAREAYLASKVSHPNVVRIYDVDVAPEGYLYLVMELVEGRTLKAALDDPEFTRAQRLEALAQVAGALEALHAIGITHRDVKTANVVLAEGTSHAMRVVAKLVDFGISRQQVARPVGGGLAPAEVPPDDLDETLTAEVLTRRTRKEGPAEASVTDTDPGRAPRWNMELTATGAVAGTPHYIAPELLDSSAGATDPAIDLFAFGVVAFEVLTGARPFGVPAAYGVIAGEDPKIAERLELPTGHPLVELLERCLALDPDARPTPSECAAVLRAAS